jgi:acyl-CoA hydrolase
MTILKSLESAFTAWLIKKVDDRITKREHKIMVLVTEVQQKIANLEALVLAERAQVTAAIDEFAARLKEALAAASNSGQDLSVLISDLERVEAEIREIYEPKAPAV